MGTLKGEDYDIMKAQIESAKGQYISKEEVLKILHEKLKEVDLKNEFIVDRIDGVAIKEVLSEIMQIKPKPRNADGSSLLSSGQVS